jgi:hypothetical protein
MLVSASEEISHLRGRAVPGILTEIRFRVYLVFRSSRNKFREGFGFSVTMNVNRLLLGKDNTEPQSQSLRQP